jgi:hypothetical protein
MITNAAEFLKLAALKRSTVEVAGETVNVRELSVKERAVLLEMMDGQRGLVPAWLVQTCAVTDDGKPMFTAKDAEALAESAPAVVDAVAAAVMRASGLGDSESPND